MNSKPNKPKLEILHPSQDLYPDLGAFALDHLEFDEVVTASFQMAYFEKTKDRELHSESKGINFDWIFDAIEPLLGLYIYSVASKDSKEQLKQNIPFNQIHELAEICGDIRAQFENTNTGQRFWNNQLLASIQEYQTLVSAKYRKFLSGSSNPYLKTFKKRIISSISAKTATRFRELFERKEARSPETFQGPLEGFNLHHQVVSDSLSKGDLDQNQERILQSVRMLKVLKFIHPDLETFAALFNRIQTDFTPVHLQEFQGNYKLTPFSLRTDHPEHALDQLVQFILFTRPNSQLITTQPFTLGSLELNPTTILEDMLYITESSVAKQLRAFDYLTQTVTELAQSQEAPVLTNGDRRYTDFPFTQYHSHIFEETEEADPAEPIEPTKPPEEITVSSTLDSFLDTVITQQLSYHGLELHPVTEHYFRAYAKYQVLKLHTAFESNPTSSSSMFIFTSEQDSFVDAIDSGAFDLAKLAQLKSDSNRKPMFAAFLSETFKKNLTVKNRNTMICPAAHEYLALFDENRRHSVIEQFDSILDTNLSMKDTYIDLVNRLDQVFDVDTILRDILTHFNVHQDGETIAGALLFLANLSNEQLIDFFNLDPAGTLDTLKKLIDSMLEVPELAKFDDIAMIIELLNVAYNQGQITEGQRTQLIEKTKQNAGEDPRTERSEIEFAIKPKNLQELINTIKLNTFYYNLIQASKSRQITLEHVQAVAYMISDLDQSDLIEQLFKYLLNSKSLSSFLTILYQMTDDQACQNLCRNFLEIIFRRIEANKDMLNLISRLDSELIKSLYGVDNNLPAQYQEWVQEYLHALDNKGLDCLSGLKSLLPKLTSKVKHSSYNQALKSLLI